jgi:hypothetical protein
MSPLRPSSPIERAIRRDSDRLVALCIVTARKAEAREHAALEVAFTKLAEALRRRLHFEEDELFPRIEHAVSEPVFAITARMRRQHRALVELLAEVEAAIGAGRLEAALFDLRELEAALRTHIDAEARALSPGLGALGSDGASLLAALEPAVPPLM